MLADTQHRDTILFLPDADGDRDFIRGTEDYLAGRGQNVLTTTFADFFASTSKTPPVVLAHWDFNFDKSSKQSCLRYFINTRFPPRLLVYSETDLTHNDCGRIPDGVIVRKPENPVSDFLSQVARCLRAYSFPPVRGNGKIERVGKLANDEESIGFGKRDVAETRPARIVTARVATLLDDAKMPVAPGGGGRINRGPARRPDPGDLFQTWAIGYMMEALRAAGELAPAERKTRFRKAIVRAEMRAIIRRHELHRS